MRFASQATLPSQGGVVGGREVCSAKLHSRGIDSVGGGPAFRGSCGGKLGGPSCRRRKVEAPDALCVADHPAPSHGLLCE